MAFANNMQSLVGREIRVNKIGSESTQGKLLAFASDHLALQNEQDGVVYYALHHIKMCLESSHHNTSSSESDQTEAQFVRAKNMSQLLQSFIGDEIEVNRGEPNAQIGILLAIHSDYITLSTDQDGVMCYKIYHIKSVNETMNEDADQETQYNWMRKMPINQGKNKALTESIDKENFGSLLETMKYRRVKINPQSPDAVEGILMESDEDQLILTTTHEVVRLPASYTQYISFSMNPQNQELENIAFKEQYGNQEDKDRKKDRKDDKTKGKG